MKTFLYLHCSDLEPMRRFYSDLLGLVEIYFSAEEGNVGYQVGTLQLTVAVNADADPVSGWARQLGWEGGDAVSPSWGFEIDEEDGFRRVVESTRADKGVFTKFTEPQWVGYWSFPVKDPMGYTVEVTTPQVNAWP